MKGLSGAALKELSVGEEGGEDNVGDEGGELQLFIDLSNSGEVGVVTGEGDAAEAEKAPERARIGGMSRRSMLGRMRMVGVGSDGVELLKNFFSNPEL